MFGDLFEEEEEESTTNNISQGKGTSVCVCIKGQMCVFVLSRDTVTTLKPLTPSAVLNFHPLTRLFVLLRLSLSNCKGLC